jgi:hypothetical protein
MSFRPNKSREYGSTKAVVAQLIEAAGGVKQAAFHIGRGLSQTYGYADESVSDAHMTLDQARRLAAATKSGALAQAAAADVGGVFTAEPVSQDSVAELLARGESARGRLMADFLRSMDRDGAAHATPEVRRDLDECIATLVAVREALKP